MATPSLPPIPATGADTMTASPLVRPPQQEGAGASDSQERARAILSQIRGIMSSIDSLALQFPSASKQLRKSSDGLKDAMLSIVQELQRQPGSNPSPNVGA